MPEPRFEGQTKTKLSNREVDGIVQKIVGEKMKHYFEMNPDTAKLLVQKLLMLHEQGKLPEKLVKQLEKVHCRAEVYQESLLTVLKKIHQKANYT